MTGVITAMTECFTAVFTWIKTAIVSMVDVFYSSADGSLTFLGVLALVSLGIGLAFLIIGVIQNFLHLRS